jgi:soluble lytic murein transglycosylase
LLLQAESVPPGAEPQAGAAAASSTAPPPDFSAEASALRRRDCPSALASLRQRAGGADRALAGMAQLLLGFYAHACADVATAERWLFEAAQPGGAFEDWRLYLLADTAAAQQHYPAALAALQKVIGDYAGSPLRGRALVRAAEIAAAAGDRQRAAEWLAQARSELLASDLVTRLDVLEWESAQAAGDAEAQRAAARHLLVNSPFEAARLGAVELFRAPDGALDWALFLSREERERRVERLLELGVTAGALTTLESFPAAERDLRFHLVKARALTLAQRGHEALALLAGMSAEDFAARAELEWARAQAAAEAAAVRRGRPLLPAAQREGLRASQRQHLWAVARAPVDRELRARALRELFAELGEEQDFDQAMQVLALLRQVDPADTSGANVLWERGWREYRTRNYSGAIGYWARLTELYPASRAARAGRYWSARAFDALGQRDRAAGLYREIAGADTTDFYRKHALARLGGSAAGPEGDEPSREAWPRDALFERARQLTDLGLDDLALAELDALVGRGLPSAEQALRALAQARKGERRESIRLLRSAFPALGGPHQETVPEEALHLFYPLDFSEEIRREARRQDLPPAVVFGIVHQESGFDPAAVSRSGARGLMQVMPATGRELARKLALPFSTERLHEPAYSVRLGTTYFRQVLVMFDGNLELALAGYNSGPFRVKRLWRASGDGAEVDAFVEGLEPAEPRLYVKRILIASDSYRQLYRWTG